SVLAPAKIASAQLPLRKTETLRCLENRGRRWRSPSRLLTPHHGSTAGFGTKRIENGKENRWLRKAASAGWLRHSVAPDRPGPRSARSEHHGILQGLQCGHAGDRKGCSDSGRDHRFCRQELHLRDE